MNLPRAVELQRMSNAMVRGLERGEEQDSEEFWARWWIISDAFLEAVREPGRWRETSGGE